MRTTSKMAVLRLLTRAALGLIFVEAGHACRGELVTPGQKNLAKAERKLDAARGRVSVTAEHLSATQGLRMARLSVLHACQAAYDAVERVRKDAENAEAIARADALEAEQAARKAGLAVGPTRLELAQAREPFLNRPLLAYDLRQHGRLTFNALTGAFDLSLEEGPGIALRPGDLEALMAGRFALPNIDPLQMAADSGGTSRRLASNYAEVQASLAAEHGAANVYLFSRRFLEWGTPERLSADFARASLNSGRPVVDELTEARRQIQLEYEDLAAWLELKGIKDLGSDPIGTVIDLVRTGSDPRLGLAVKTRLVDYTDRRESTGRTGLPYDYLKRLRPKGLPAYRPAQQFTEKRPALAIIWNGPARSRPSLASRLESAFRLSAPVINDIPKRLPIRTDPRVRHLLEETALHGLGDIDAAAQPRRAARTAIGLRKEDLTPAGVSNRIIVDMRSTDLGEIVDGFLSQLALGNGKSCHLDMLELDQASGRLEAGFTLRHRHTWPTLREAQAQLRGALGPVGTEVEDLAERLPDAGFDGARAVYHQADTKAREAVRYAHEAQQRAQAAAARVSSKRQDLAALAAELDRARIDLRAATEREASARHEAQDACVQMLQLDAQVRIARNKANELQVPTSAKPLLYGGLDATKRW